MRACFSRRERCWCVFDWRSSLLPFFLSSYLPIFLSSFLPFFLSSFLPSSFLPFFLSSFLPFFLSFFLPFFLSPIFLSSYLPFFLSSFLPIFLSSFLYVFLCSFLIRCKGSIVVTELLGRFGFRFQISPVPYRFSIQSETRTSITSISRLDPAISILQILTQQGR